MKRLLSSLLCIMLIFSAFGCSSATDDMIVVNKNNVAKVTPVDFKVLSIEAGGLTNEELYLALQDGVDNYYINITIDDVTFPISGAEFGMSFNKDIDLKNAAERIYKGELTAEDIGNQLFTIDETKLTKELFMDEYAAYLQFLIENQKEDAKTAQKTENEDIKSLEERLNMVYGKTRAHIEYNSVKGEFKGVDGVAGETFDFSRAVLDFADAVRTLSPSLTLTLPVVESEGEDFEGNEILMAALEKAASYLSLEIVYKFNPPGGKAGQETINSKNIMEYIYVALNGRDIDVDTDELTTLATSYVLQYSNVEVTEENVDENTVNITRTGWEVTFGEIYDNLLKSLTNVTSNIYEASYTEVNETTKADKDDLYVFVDLTAQRVYLYEGGVIVYSTPCVSGKVSAGNMTKTGTFKIYSKETNRTLKGRNYSSFVKYWMPFNGNIGLHDASWRGEFGGDIYVYDGSHGCVNLSRSAAKYIFNKVKVGTTVVVTGGLTTVKGYSGSSSGSGSAASSSTAAATTKADQTTSEPSASASEVTTIEEGASSSENASTPGEGSTSAESESSSVEESGSEASSELSKETE